MNFLALFFFIFLPLQPIIYFVFIDTKKWYINTLKRSFIILIFVSLMSLIYTLNILTELHSIELKGDAMMYLEDAKMYHQTGYTIGSNPFFPEILSFASIGKYYYIWIRLYLSLIVSVTYFFGEVIIIRATNYKISNIYIYFFLFGLNLGFASLGFVIVRDIFILLSILCIFLMFDIIKNENKFTLPIFIFLTFSSFLLIKMQFLLFLIILFVFVISYLKIEFKSLTTFLVLILAVALIINYIIDLKTLQHIIQVNFIEKQRAEQGGGSFGIIGDTIRFIFGPGIVRPLFGNIFFTITQYPSFYNFSYSYASFIWYIILIFFSPYLLSKYNLLESKNKYMLLFLFFFIISYVLTDSGQTGLRKRMIMYDLFLIWFLSNYKVKFKELKRNNHFIIMTTMTIFLAGLTFFSIKI
jgi:hypothetical protein